MQTARLPRPIYLAILILQCAVIALASPLLRHEVYNAAIPGSGLTRRQEETVIVTGITTYGVQPRLEIRQLQKNADQWNIFLLGMKHFQETDQSDTDSYYQIAGIHGRPYVPWDDSPPKSGLNSPGYCMHVLNLFLAWHRAYLALFEQTLYKHIIAAVNDFPAGALRQRYASAALSWRFPYWDWAAVPSDGGSVWPESMSMPTVKVTMPNGTAEIPNPLYSYRFHPVSQDDFYFDPFSSWNETKRFPTSWDNDATSQDSALGPIFDNNRVSFQDRLYNLFTNTDNFTQFATEAWMDDVRNADSLESLHDVVHGIVGNTGHMTYLDYSAYDPSFMLHHAMLDRCFALWQALYPDSYVEPMKAVEQTFTVRIGDRKDGNSPLQPFYASSNRKYWTANQLKSTGKLGYTYPELANNANVSAVKAAINRLYGSSAGSDGLSKRALRTSKPKDNNDANTNTDSSFDDDDGKSRQYTANILCQKFALNSSFAIYVFLGDFDDTPAAWATAPHLVGTHAVFTGMTGAVGRVREGEKDKVPVVEKPAIRVTGTMPLTSMLLEKVATGELGDMSPQVVEEYLEANLRWRVSLFDGIPVSAADVADLSVTVVSAEVAPAASIDQFPSWSNFETLTRITRGKPGGC